MNFNIYCNPAVLVAMSLPDNTDKGLTQGYRKKKNGKNIGIFLNQSVWKRSLVMKIKMVKSAFVGSFWFIRNVSDATISLIQHDRYKSTFHCFYFHNETSQSMACWQV